MSPAMASAGAGSGPSAAALAGPSFAAAGPPVYALPPPPPPQPIPVYDYGTSLAQAAGNSQSAAFGGYGGLFGGLAAGQAAGGSQALASGAYGISGPEYWPTFLSQAAGGIGAAAQSKLILIHKRHSHILNDNFFITGANIGGIYGGLSAGQASGLYGNSQALATGYPYALRH